MVGTAMETRHSTAIPGVPAITTECAPTAQCRRRQPVATVATGIENDFPATGLADEEGLRAAHPRYPVARAAAGSNVRVFGVQPDNGIELLVQSPVDSTETKEV